MTNTAAPAARPLVMDMTLTVTASWTQPSADINRIDIAGYTGIVQKVEDVYEYTVFAGGGGRIVEVGQRKDQFAALITVERLIGEDVEANTVGMR